MTQLRGWKDIARYLGVSVSTAIRLRKKGLPIRQFSSHKGEGVYAFADELDRFLREEAERDSQQNHHHLVEKKESLEQAPSPRPTDSIANDAKSAHDNDDAESSTPAHAASGTTPPWRYAAGLRRGAVLAAMLFFLGLSAVLYLMW